MRSHPTCVFGVLASFCAVVRRTVPTRRNTSYTPPRTLSPAPPRGRAPPVRFGIPGAALSRHAFWTGTSAGGTPAAARARARAPVAVPDCNTLLIGFGPRFARGLVPIGIILDVAPVVTVQHSSKLGSLGSPGSRAFLIHFLSLLLLCRGRGR